MIRKDDETKHTQIAERLRDVTGVESALNKAARQAIHQHARAGRRIAVWRNNRVVWEDAVSKEARGT